MLSAMAVCDLRQSGSIILHFHLHLMTTLLSQTICHYMTTPPPNRRWKILSFILFMFRDVGMLVVFLNDACLRDDNTAWVVWFVATTTLGLLNVAAVAVVVIRATRHAFLGSGAISFGLLRLAADADMSVITSLVGWVAAIAIVVIIVAGCCHDEIASLNLCLVVVTNNTQQ